MATLFRQRNSSRPKSGEYFKITYHEDEHKTHAKCDTGEHWYNPVDVAVGGPSKPK